MTAAAEYRVIEPVEAIAAELRGMAGELMARSDVARANGGRMNAYDAAYVLLARADEMEGLS